MLRVHRPQRHSKNHFDSVPTPLSRTIICKTKNHSNSELVRLRTYITHTTFLSGCFWRIKITTQKHGDVGTLHKEEAEQQPLHHRVKVFSCHIAPGKGRITQILPILAPSQFELRDVFHPLFCTHRIHLSSSWAVFDPLEHLILTTSYTATSPSTQVPSPPQSAPPSAANKASQYGSPASPHQANPPSPSPSNKPSSDHPITSPPTA